MHVDSFNEMIVYECVFSILLMSEPFLLNGNDNNIVNGVFINNWTIVLVIVSIGSLDFTIRQRLCLVFFKRVVSFVFLLTKPHITNNVNP